MIKVKINSPLKWRKRKSMNENEEEETNKIDNENKNLIRKVSIDYNYPIQDIEIPPNTEEMDKQILLDNYISRRNLLNNFLNKRTNTINPVSNRTIGANFSRNNPFKIKLPEITTPNYTLEEAIAA